MTEPASLQSIPNILRDERLRQGLSQLDLSVRLGVTRSVVSDWETGRGDLRVGTLERWAGGLGIDLRTFLEKRA